MSTIDCVLEEHLSKDEYDSLAKSIYEKTLGEHFDEYFAKKQISKMFYTDNGIKVYAPYWSDTLPVYNSNKSKLIYPYNRWDFEVTLNMIKSDYWPLLKRWFPEEKDLNSKLIDLTINWLNDEDYPENKIWKYFR